MESAAYPLVVALVGATATGKSALSLDLAEALTGEIIGADASQLYRGMDIGTAKLTLRERRGIAHHQIDVLDIHDEATVAAYQRHARADIDAIAARGRVPILVGGSGLYVRAALDRLEIPPTDPGVRARLEEELHTLGVEELRQRLLDLDPVAADSIEARNGRRIVRALEVIELTGKRFSATMPTREALRPTVFIGLRTPRPILDRRIAERTEDMWSQGLIAEVEGLLGEGLETTRTAARAVGYAQAVDQIRGRSTEAEAIASTVAATRRLVRRQESWFGADPRIHWIDTHTGGGQARPLPDLVSDTLNVVAGGARIGPATRE